MNDQYLMHYGIKGMKWGVRRAQKQDSSEAPAKKNKPKRSAREITARGATTAVGVVSKIGTLSLTDDIFYGGAGKRTIKNIGRAALTAYWKSKGDTNIQWFD